MLLINKCFIKLFRHGSNHRNTNENKMHLCLKDKKIYFKIVFGYGKGYGVPGIVVTGMYTGTYFLKGNLTVCS